MSFIYIVFSQPHELVELQSLLDVEWNLIKTKEIIEAFERD